MAKIPDFEISGFQLWTTLQELADKGKKDVMGVASEELRNLLIKLLSQGTIEIDAKIRIVPKTEKKKRARPKAP